jgi:hypothetical protein
MATNRVRGFAAWSPQTRTAPTLFQAHSIINNYRDIWPITARQLFYRMVALHDYPKTEAGYKTLLSILNRARRAKMIPMEAIRDDGTKVMGAYRYDDADAYFADAIYGAKFCELNLQQFQDQHLIVWCEAAGMVPQLNRVARQYGVEVRSSGGFDSTTFKHEVGKLIGEMYKPVRIIHVGDLDPSGEHIHLALEEDLKAFAEHYGNDDVTLDRLAVTAEQQQLYNLPTAPPKPSDKRAFDHNFTVQCEALPPEVLSDMIKTAIEESIDLDTWEEAIQSQNELRQQLEAALRHTAENFNS